MKDLWRPTFLKILVIILILWAIYLWVVSMRPETPETPRDASASATVSPAACMIHETPRRRRS